MAIEQGLLVLGWYENLPSEDVPPEHIWEDAEGLEQWWKRVEERRADGRPADQPGRSSESEGDGDQDTGMAENDIARFFKRD